LNFSLQAIISDPGKLGAHMVSGPSTKLSTLHLLERNIAVPFKGVSPAARKDGHAGDEATRDGEDGGGGVEGGGGEGVDNFESCLFRPTTWKIRWPHQQSREGSLEMRRRKKEKREPTWKMGEIKQGKSVTGRRHSNRESLPGNG